MNPDANKTIPEVFAAACAEYAERPAFTCMGHTLSYAELDRLSANFATWLTRNTSLEPGDRIAVQLPNILQYPVVVFGAMRAGLVVVNTNPLYTPKEIQHQLTDSGAKALVVLANIAHTAASVVENTAVEKVIVTQLGDLHPPVKRVLVNFVVRYIKKMVPPFSFSNAVNLNDTLSTDGSSWRDVDRSADDVAVLQYTGGTTGVAKGAMLTHKNLVANMWQISTHLDKWFRSSQEYFVAPLPLYHIYAFTTHCLVSLGRGNRSLLIPNPRDIPAFVKALQGVPFTVFVGLNTLFNALCRNENFAKLDFSQLQLTIAGGMALTEAAAKRWESVTGVPICEGYGLTETSPVVAVNQPDSIQLGTIGRPLPDTECKVIDDDGRDLPNGEEGELCIRGPQVMKGYWERPDATAEVLNAEGWFKSGDIAIIQDDGFIKIVDRKKDMINVSGFKVFPNEVEDVLAAHPDVVEAAVVGVPDGEGSEIVKAFVVAGNSSLTETDIREHAKTQLTAYKVPHQVEFRDELPKTNVGKMLRRKLREEEEKKS